MNKTSIEWTHRPQTGGAAGGFTWNPIRARFKNPTKLGDGGGLIVRPHSGTFCTRISPGCTNCYASVINKRFGNGLEYTVPNLSNIEFYISETILAEPLKRKKPATIFVGDMFDLFHEAIPTGMIAEVLRVAYKTRRHTFQFLTKRAQRMRDMVNEAWRQWGVTVPPDHMWFGVSVEDKKRAIERVPRLQETICAIRFLSVEPQLEDINFTVESPEVGAINLLRGFDGCDPVIPGINLVICGGESGPGARIFRTVWANRLLEQCRAANIPFFMKQLGSYPVLDPRYDQTISGATRKLRDRKGGDMEEWPESLRVREFPG
jgi:protein gp37